MAPRLLAEPLQPWERDGIAAALDGAGLSKADITDPGLLVWRFQTGTDVPVGFGGLEIHGEDALLRAVVTLPPLRRRGFARAMVAAMAEEASNRDCRALWLSATAHADVFRELGFDPCAPDEVPAAIRATAPFAAGASGGTPMVKRL